MNIGAKDFGMGAQIGERGITLYLAGGAFVDNVEALTQPDQGWSLAYNVVGQAMQRAHAVTNAGEQPLLLTEKIANPAPKIFDGAVGEGDN